MNGDESRVVAGRNAVGEVFRTGIRIRCLHLAERGGGRDLKNLAEQARQRGVKVVFSDRDTLDRISGGIRHQGAAAVLDPFAYADFDQLLKSVKESRGLLLVLDSVQDPRNLGAIIRSAEALGAGGVLIPRDRQAPITPTAERAAAGATAHLPVSRIGNLARTLERLKKEGYWVVGADSARGSAPERIDLPRPLALVLGSEEKGIRPVNLKQCDALVRIPLSGRVDSLNVAVAAGILVYELMKNGDQPPPLTDH